MPANIGKTDAAFSGHIITRNPAATVIAELNIAALPAASRILLRSCGTNFSVPIRISTSPKQRTSVETAAPGIRISTAPSTARNTAEPGLFRFSFTI